MQELPQLSIESCRVRQQRLCEALADQKADRAILVAPENVQWLTGFRTHPLMRAVAVLDVDDGCMLIAPGEDPPHHAADEIQVFDAQWRCTLRQDQLKAAMQRVKKSNKRTAIEFSSSVEHVRQSLVSDPIDLDSTLWSLRRRKEPDELGMMLHAIDCTDAMYQRAREIIRPGISELEVFCQLQSVAVQTAGEPLTALGNDYQSNSPGGPPRTRPAQAGELMILDLGPAYRGYHADNCRTFAVNGQPTDEQLRARDVIMTVFDLVKAFVKPGQSCRELFVQAKALLDEYEPDAFFHHLGHGVGLYPHEAPHLNPSWDDRFAEGDVFTVEPGLYNASLRAGIRIEENYVVTSSGVRQLTKTSTQL